MTKPPSSGSITNRDLYDALDGMRREFTGSIQRLDDKFNTLEAGRLTRAEANINQLAIDLQKAINAFNSKIDTVRQSGSVLSTKAAIIGSIIMIILTSFTAALFYRLLVVKP